MTNSEDANLIPTQPAVQATRRGYRHFTKEFLLDSAIRWLEAQGAVVTRSAGSGTTLSNTPMGHEANVYVHAYPRAVQKHLAFYVECVAAGDGRTSRLVVMPKLPAWISAAFRTDRAQRDSGRVWWLFVDLDGHVDVVPPPDVRFVASSGNPGS